MTKRKLKHPISNILCSQHFDRNVYISLKSITFGVSTHTAEVSQRYPTQNDRTQNPQYSETAVLKNRSLKNHTAQYSKTAVSKTAILKNRSTQKPQYSKSAVLKIRILCELRQTNKTYFYDWNHLVSGIGVGIQRIWKEFFTVHCSFGVQAGVHFDTRIQHSSRIKSFRRVRTILNHAGDNLLL